MNDMFLTLPISGKRIYDGTIIVLANFPNTKWVVHNGWFKYNNKATKGWYVSSIPDESTKPLTQSDLPNVTIVSDAGGGDYPIPPCPPGPPGPPGPCPPGPCPPGPPGPHPPQPPQAVYTIVDADHLSRAFLSVDTVGDRDLLNLRYVPHGKIVRVNNGQDSRPEYYQWNSVTSQWDALDFGASILTKAEVEDEYSTKAEVQEKVDTVDQKIDDQAEESQQKFDELTETINTIVGDISWEEI